MDDLDKQLAELQLITNTELQPNPNLQQHGTLGKKVGPAVPPKPKKTQPQVPQSYSIKQHQEPSYSSGLQQQNATQLYSNLPADAQYANIGQNAQYSNLPTMRSNPVQNMTPKGYAKPQEVMYSNIHLGHRNPDGLIYSNIIHPPRDNNVYRNMPSGVGGAAYANGVCVGDDLPPPPPPIDAHVPEYAPVTVNTHFPPPPDELPPPPSPVSSSYSELRRATQSNQDYNSYGMGSQSSSTYESIYEPINPRPQSQMSSRSNYSLYAPYVSGNSSHMSVGPSQSASRAGMAKEHEVDTLTDLMVQCMGGGSNAQGEGDEGPDAFGYCGKCGEKVVGENSGCTAMDQIFHTTCFTCHHCAMNLQGKPFYSLEGKAYCEEDYMNTLEKCCVCTKPILDRILRATGKPYHPKCFICVMCGKSLDGIPFTVDATNQILCIEDFHKKFAPRCCVCKLPIMPEPGQDETVRVVALDRSFHIPCYKCEDCGVLLSSEAEGRGCYPLDDHILCKSCNAKRVQALTSHMTTDL